MNLAALKYVYLLGAGGIGMSALGRYFIQRGILAGGYDRTPTALTDQLIHEGFNLNFTDTEDAIPEVLKTLNNEEFLVIYTPAIPSDSAQLNYFRKRNVPVYKRAMVLGAISKEHHTIAVAGTHGKTTTSSMIAHLLKSAGRNPVAFLGGITANYNTNYLPGAADSILVAEADEYDRSFLNLHPDTAVITSVDPDHLDIYGAREALLNTFAEFGRQTSPAGHLIVKAGLELPTDLMARASTYHTSLPATVQLKNCRQEHGYYHFDVHIGDRILADLSLGMAGYHNVENALAAVAAAWYNGLNEQEIREGLASFLGVKRRFEYIIRRPDLIFIDDYAHHPEELRACIAAVRELYPDRRISGVFQPHLFSRTRDFYHGFADSLSLLDDVILLEIYPARELPIPGVSSSVLLDMISSGTRRLATKEELPELIASLHPEVLLTLGAGDIDQLVEPVRQRLIAEKQAV